MTPLRQRMLEDMAIRNLAENTQAACIQQVIACAGHFRRSPEEPGAGEIRACQVCLTQTRVLSASSVGVATGALRFPCKVTLQRTRAVEGISMPKRPFKLPVILGREEAMHLLDSIGNLKHRAILVTAYAAGLRIAEATHLKVTDIDSQRMMLRVDQGEGRKDRYVMLSPRLLAALSARWKAAHPTPWLFSGDLPGQPTTPPLAASRARHPPAWVRHRCAHHSAAARAPQSGHGLALPEGCHRYRVRHSQSI